jgi:alpha-beta hydrolase superfamily lysophospholipase
VSTAGGVKDGVKQRMRRGLYRWARRAVLLSLAIVATLIVYRAVDSQRGPPLEPWHTFVPDDAHAAAIERMDWPGWMAAEGHVFDQVKSEVSDRLEEGDRTPDNRYFTASPVYPGHFAQDWNRSYVLMPDGPPRGAVVLLHGLTDSPYSLRHVARRYRALGFVAIAIRLPAHGTVPAALTDVVWEDWAAATRLAVREARRLSGGNTPLHMVGFSNGGALAMQYALDAIEDPRLPRPDRLVLISPMIGITAFARFVGLAALPAILPAFAKAAWLGVVPEFNPFKYNSFPVNGAWQSHRLTQTLQQRIQQLGRSGRLSGLAPVLTFQSVMDFTVSTRAIITALYMQLPPNGSELVLFDRNSNSKVGALLRPAVDLALGRMLPSPPLSFRLTVIANADSGSDEVVERIIEPGSSAERTRALDQSYPRNVFSLSHVALPFPVTDNLYGADPDLSEDFGVHLGALAARGEVGVLLISPATLMRISWNPFFPYVMRRIEENIPSSTTQ